MHHGNYGLEACRRRQAEICNKKYASGRQVGKWSAVHASARSVSRDQIPNPTQDITKGNQKISVSSPERSVTSCERRSKPDRRGLGLKLKVQAGLPTKSPQQHLPQPASAGKIAQMPRVSNQNLQSFCFDPRHTASSSWTASQIPTDDTSFQARLFVSVHVSIMWPTYPDPTTELGQTAQRPLSPITNAHDIAIFRANVATPCHVAYALNRLELLAQL